MKRTVALLFTALELGLVIAFPPLQARDDFFRLPGVNLPSILDGIGGAFDETAQEAQEYFMGKPPVLSPTLTSTPTPAPVPDTGSSSDSDPVYRVEIHNQPPPAVPTGSAEPADSPTSGVDASSFPGPVRNGDTPGNPDEAPEIQGLSSPTATDDCDPAADSDECDKAVDYIIFSKSCEHIDEDLVLTQDAIATNEVVTQKLTLIPGSDVLVSKSDKCDIFFWSALLTGKKKEEIKKFPGVGNIIPNRPVGSTTFPAPADSLKNEPVKAPAALQRRDIIHDNDAADDLSFISTPRGQPLARRYSYDERSGQGQTVIYVGFGLKDYQSEFRRQSRSIVNKYISGLRRIDDAAPDSDSTCPISKAVGLRYGVVKNARLVSVDVVPTVASVYDALIKVTNYLGTLRYEEVRGYYTLALEPEWSAPDGRVNVEFVRLMRHFLTNWQIPVVTSSGFDPQSQISPLESELALMVYLLPIIVAGAVGIYTGETLLWSRRTSLTISDPGMMMSVPGVVRCAAIWDGVPQDISGSVTFAQLAGVIAYFLSLQETGYRLRHDPSFTVPQALMIFLKSDAASYIRGLGIDRAIWNGEGP